MVVESLLSYTNLWVGIPFFEKLVTKCWYRYQFWGSGVNTFRFFENGVGTQWVGILNWYPPCLNISSPLDIFKHDLC